MLGEHEAAGAIPVIQTKTACSSGAEHVADYDGAAGAIPATRTISHATDPQIRNTTERRSLVRVQVLPVVLPYVALWEGPAVQMRARSVRSAGDVRSPGSLSSEPGRRVA